MSCMNKAVHLGFASPAAGDVPMVPNGAEFVAIYDERTGEPTHLYYPEFDMTVPILYN